MDSKMDNQLNSICILSAVRGSSTLSKALDHRTISLNAELEDINGSGWRFCFWNCTDCEPAIEIAPFHVDCFRIFKRNAPNPATLDYLWWRCLWRWPWRHGMNLPLTEPLTYDPEVLSSVGAAYGLAQLQKMPPVVIRAVHNFCENSIFWRLVKALSAATAASRLQDDGGNTFTSTGIKELKKWTRGRRPVLQSDDEPLAPIIRVAFDAAGLKNIERLPDREVAYSPSSRSDSEAYVFDHDANLAGAELQYKVSKLGRPVWGRRNARA